MEKLQPEELEELVQELEGESAEEVASSPEVEQLLRDLDSERPMELKVEAVRQLGELRTSSPQIVKALADASMWDANPQFRRLSAAALLAPAHQAVIEQHPDVLPRHVTNLLREIKEAGEKMAAPELKEVEDSREDAPARRVEDLLHALQHGSSVRVRARAAARLGQVEESNPEIVEALIAARDNEPFYAVRKAAVEALGAPVHEAVLQADAGLMMRVQQEAAPRDWEAELLASPLKPERLRVESGGNTLSLSWRDGVLHKVLSAGFTALLLLALGYALFAGTYSGEGLGIVALALLLPVYWALVAFVNSTQIKLSREQWSFQRGPFPFPNRSFYSARTRIDPAAYKEIRTVQVKEKRRAGGGSSSDIEGVIAEVLVGALVEQFTEPRITYSLYARAKDGSDKLLLDRLEGHEADYLKHTLQEMLDTEYLASMQKEPGGQMDGEAPPAQVQAEPAEGAAQHLERAQGPSVPIELGALQKSKWIVLGNLAIVLAWAAGVHAGTYLATGSFSWLPENLLRIVEAAATGMRYGFCCTLPVLAFGLFLLGMVGRGFIAGKLRRANLVGSIVIGAVIAAVGGCLFGWFAVVEWYY